MYKKDFPIFTTHPDLVYLDSASSAQKPRHVIESLTRFFETDYANIHRGAYDLSMESSGLYDRAKEAIAKNLVWVLASEITFTYNATYAANLIARSLVKTGLLKKWDRILLSKVEHHANIVPWQIIAEEYGIVIDWIDIHPNATIDYASLVEKLLWAKVIAITGASNVTGEILDIAKVCNIMDSLPEWQRPLFVMDGSQRFPHMQTDVRKYGIDIFFATGHKGMSDTGIGFFYARKDLLRTLVPVFCGGWAINSVTLDGYEPAGLPFRHEPGTPHIAGAVSLLAALEYIESIGGFEEVEKYERELTEYALQRFREGGILESNSKIRLLGSPYAGNRLWVFSFAFDAAHPHDIAEKLADLGICVRSGHHCTEPLHHALGIGASLRASFYIYNTREDVERFVENLKRIIN